MRLRTLAVGGLAVAVSATLTAATAWADTAAPAAGAAAVADPPVIADDAGLAHLRKFQQIAEANGGTRANGRPGFKATVDYLETTLKAAGFQVTVQPFTASGAQSWNVIADWPSGDANRIVMIGAHTDSVPAGPGINDDGSGVATVLENALTVARTKAQSDQRMRFGFWGAEEIGLLGSKHYAGSLGAEKSKITAYLNFDMVGMKNTKKWGIYKEGPALNAHFKEYFDKKGIPTATIDPTGMSDHSSFARVGIPVTGIGSDSNLQQLDPCYHKACDTFTNVDGRTIGIGANAAATVMWKLAGTRTTARP
ncbi:aminopeptidase [Pilimelia terevasa]|uniref:Aminopeptidase n=1 Tax=Pilimelia terevasa TaxID=53372 RepID=A0A8J3BF08_9ACTN|nr:M20/M25/M40 family metallo-hydrolase [Pilimelia terevasa]GGK16526.1 aminopeptidase [Pilimelia terevasa]